MSSSQTNISYTFLLVDYGSSFNDWWGKVHMNYSAHELITWYSCHFFLHFDSCPCNCLRYWLQILTHWWIQWGWIHVLDLALRYIEKPILLIKTIKIERTFKVLIICESKKMKWCSFIPFPQSKFVKYPKKRLMKHLWKS
jgi:hypothetical protein